jgi:hypothetical protein
MASQPTPIADIHTPDELLENAEALLATGNPKMLRAAILEAMTALEAYVYKTVFSTLESKIDPLLVKWLEEKTRMDFDSRLAVMTPVATGLAVDKQSKLWIDYKAAKETRNKVTHSGKKVSREDARFVVDTVYNWLTYLGKTVGLSLALRQFKAYVEDKGLTIGNDSQAIQLIVDYFGRTGAAQAASDVKIPAFNTMADVVLRIGDEVALIDAKYGQFNDARLDQLLTKAERAALGHVSNTEWDGKQLRAKFIVVFFARGPIPDKFDSIIDIANNAQLVVVRTLKP